MKKLKGGCRCGQLRYEVEADKLPKTYACHCLDCQTWSGSAFSQNALVKTNAFAATGETARFELAGGSGFVSYQSACPKCFTRVFNTNSARPGLVGIRAGTFDESNKLELVAHIWTNRSQRGLRLDPKMPCWQEGAPAEVLFSLLDLPMPS
ncbi:GFA family protein [Rhizobium leguminosarum]|uniref:GFA family protein n=1 Tax=Rhizobium leguminosarum TaxID=384 RepID=UPI0010372D3B|nr:GFA family protein [Rhizobium leguminosarum]TBF85836.1 aldehyde-activating protein [Rhizobium leguminosarum]